MSIDVALMRRVLNHIKAHPAQWDQYNWITRTPTGVAYCFAVWVVKMCDIPFSPLAGSVLMEDVPAKYVVEIKRRLFSGAVLAPAAVVAAVLLGLDRNQAARLFSPRNTLVRLEELVDELVQSVSIA